MQIEKIAVAPLKSSGMQAKTAPTMNNSTNKLGNFFFVSTGRFIAGDGT